MPVTFDAASSASFSTATSTKSWTHTLSTAGDVLVGVGYRSTASSAVAVSAVTVGGATATLIAASCNIGAVRVKQGAELWGITDQTSGAKIVEVTMTNSSLSVPAKAFAVSYSGSTGFEGAAKSTGATSAANVVVPVATSSAVPFGVVSYATSAALSSGSGVAILAQVSATPPSAGVGDLAPGSSGNQTVALNKAAAAGWAAAGVAVVPKAPPESSRSARLHWMEAEVPTAPRRARFHWAEAEVPTAPRRARFHWGEVEVPDPPTTERRARFYFAEVEVPTAPRRARFHFAELETPTAPRRARLHFAEFEAPTAPRRAVLYWGEAEVPTAPRMARMHWGEFEVPDVVVAPTEAPRRGTVAEPGESFNPRRVVSHIPTPRPAISLRSPGAKGTPVEHISVQSRHSTPVAQEGAEPEPPEVGGEVRKATRLHFDEGVQAKSNKEIVDDTMQNMQRWDNVMKESQKLSRRGERLKVNEANVRHEVAKRAEEQEEKKQRAKKLANRIKMARVRGKGKRRG